MKKIIISFLLLTISITHSFPSTDITKVSKAQEAYYEGGRQWDYLENILNNRLNEVNSEINNNINKTSVSLGIATFFLINFLGMSEIKQLKNVEKLLVEAGILVAGTFVGGMTKLILNAIFENKIKDEKLVNVIEMFLQKYDPNINPSSNEINYKKLIPQELHKTFDLLHQEYKESGKISLQQNSLDIIKSILDEIIYKVKKTKYDAQRQEQLALLNRINSNANASMISGAVASNALR